MIDPKQKALKIVECYVNEFKKTDTCFTDCKNSLKCQHSSYNCESWFETAKECAKIAVNEIIEVLSISAISISHRIQEESYWQEVLNELNKM